MKYREIKFTDDERLEMIRLMLGMRCVTKLELKMGVYARNPGEYEELRPSEVINKCGTAACLLGHTPLFCKLKPEGNIGWGRYADDLFGVVGKIRMYQFLFHADWSDSKEQAVARIYIALTEGVPIGFIAGYDEYDVPAYDVVERYAADYGITVEEVLSSIDSRV